MTVVQNYTAVFSGPSHGINSKPLLITRWATLSAVSITQATIFLFIKLATVIFDCKYYSFSTKNMSAVYAAGKTVKNGITKQYIRDIFLTVTRNRESRWLGYYKKKLPTNVYRYCCIHLEISLLVSNLPDIFHVHCNKPEQF